MDMACESKIGLNVLFVLSQGKQTNFIVQRNPVDLKKRTGLRKIPTVKTANYVMFKPHRKVANGLNKLLNHALCSG